MLENGRFIAVAEGTLIGWKGWMDLAVASVQAEGLLNDV
jgi:hypothetical protein